MQKIIILSLFLLLSAFSAKAFSVADLETLTSQFKQNGGSDAGIAFLNDEINKLKAKNTSSNSNQLDALKKELKMLSTAEKFDKVKYSKAVSKYNRISLKFAKDTEKTLVMAMTKLIKKDREALNMVLVNFVLAK
jgi:hypothetical protein